MDRKQRIEQERESYVKDRIRRHPLNHSLFYTQERTLGNFILVKQGFEKFLRRKLDGFEPRRVLIAPSGGFGDMTFVKHLWPNAHAFGTDISTEAISAIPHNDCPTAAADIQGELPFSDPSFDLVIARPETTRIMNGTAANRDELA
jgi:hypothetical protein